MNNLRMVADLFKKTFARISAIEARTMRGKKGEGLKLMSANVETIARRLVALEKRVKELEGQ